MAADGRHGLLGAIICGWLAYVRLFGYQSIGDRPLLLFGILLVFTGVQLVTLGLLAEMLARTYHESQGKPTYLIREIRETPAGRPREAVGASALGPLVLLTQPTARPAGFSGHPTRVDRDARVLN